MNPRFTLQPAEGYRNCHFLYDGDSVLGELVDFNARDRHKILRTLNLRKRMFDALENIEAAICDDMENRLDDRTEYACVEWLETIRAVIRDAKKGVA